MGKLKLTKQTSFTDLMFEDIDDLKDYLKENLNAKLYKKFNETCGVYVAESGLIQEVILSFIMNHFIFNMSFGDSLRSALLEWDL